MIAYAHSIERILEVINGWEGSVQGDQSVLKSSRERHIRERVEGRDRELGNIQVHVHDTSDFVDRRHGSLNDTVCGGNVALDACSDRGESGVNET